MSYDFIVERLRQPIQILYDIPDEENQIIIRAVDELMGKKANVLSGDARIAAIVHSKIIDFSVARHLDPEGFFNPHEPSCGYHWDIYALDQLGELKGFKDHATACSFICRNGVNKYPIFRNHSEVGFVLGYKGGIDNLIPWFIFPGHLLSPENRHLWQISKYDLGDDAPNAQIATLELDAIDSIIKLS